MKPLNNYRSDEEQQELKRKRDEANQREDSADDGDLPSANMGACKKTKASRTPPAKTISWPQGVKIRDNVLYEGNRICGDLNKISQALQSDKCPKDLNIILSDLTLSDTDIKVLAQGLQSNQCPQDLKLTFKFCKISDERFQALANVVKSGECQPGLTLELHNIIDISTANVKVLANALQSGNCPQRFGLSLVSDNINDECAEAIAKTLQSGECPDGLFIQLSTSNITALGGLALAEALRSGKSPLNLQLKLISNELGDVGVIAFANALKSNNCSNGLTLALIGIGISNKGSTALFRALKSGKCPQSLSLDLSHNSLCKESIEALGESLQSDKCPEGLKLKLQHTKLSNKTMKPLICALESNKCPYGLQLDLQENEIYFLQDKNKFLEAISLPDNDPRVFELQLEVGTNIQKQLDKATAKNRQLFFSRNLISQIIPFAQMLHNTRSQRRARKTRKLSALEKIPPDVWKIIFGHVAYFNKKPFFNSRRQENKSASHGKRNITLFNSVINSVEETFKAIDTSKQSSIQRFCEPLIAKLSHDDIDESQIKDLFSTSIKAFIESDPATEANKNSDDIYNELNIRIDALNNQSTPKKDALKVALQASQAEAQGNQLRVKKS